MYRCRYLFIHYFTYDLSIYLSTYSFFCTFIFFVSLIIPTSWQTFPNSFRWKSCPTKNWRMKDSPFGILPSWDRHNKELYQPSLGLLARYWITWLSCRWSGITSKALNDLHTLTISSTQKISYHFNPCSTHRDKLSLGNKWFNLFK